MWVCFALLLGPSLDDNAGSDDRPFGSHRATRVGWLCTNGPGVELSILLPIHGIPDRGDGES